ncbi:MAG TPA: hypothetical protein QF772_08035, partial [Nitrospinaceae bacterium]|nr:hypothetical protein [Nitrospinaceae bacterium]
AGNTPAHEWPFPRWYSQRYVQEGRERRQVSHHSTQLTLKAHFIPKPFFGQIYWSLMSKFHSYIFNGMLAHFYQRAINSRTQLT